MKITEIEATYSRTKNTGNYNSRRVELSARASLSEEESASVSLHLFDLYNLLKLEADRLLEKERN